LPAVVVDGMLTSTTSVARVSLGAKEVILVRWLFRAYNKQTQGEGAVVVVCVRGGWWKVDLVGGVVKLCDCKSEDVV
jgi:phosphosulfolactate phosphohydrolase-like enzyme